MPKSHSCVCTGLALHTSASILFLLSFLSRVEGGPSGRETDGSLFTPSLRPLSKPQTVNLAAPYTHSVPPPTVAVARNSDPDNFLDRKRHLAHEFLSILRPPLYPSDHVFMPPKRMTTLSDGKQPLGNHLLQQSPPPIFLSFAVAGSPSHRAHGCIQWQRDSSPSAL